MAAEQVTTWQTCLNGIAFFGTSRDISTGAAEYRDWPPDEARGIRGSCCLIVDTFPDRSRPPKCTSKSRFEVWLRAIHCCPYATTPLCLSLSHTATCSNFPLSLTISCTCCYDVIKGIQDLKMRSHADSLIPCHTAACSNFIPHCII